MAPAGAEVPLLLLQNLEKNLELLLPVLNATLDGENDSLGSARHFCNVISEY
jgi:hypothetical protein